MKNRSTSKAKCSKRCTEINLYMDKNLGINLTYVAWKLKAGVNIPIHYTEHIILNIYLISSDKTWRQQKVQHCGPKEFSKSKNYVRTWSVNMVQNQECDRARTKSSSLSQTSNAAALSWCRLFLLICQCHQVRNVSLDY